MSNLDDFAKFNTPVEKSWTPILQDESANIATLSAQSGSSLRWGNYVWICFGLVTSSIAGLTGTDALLIKGLPYGTSAGATIHLTSLDGLSLAAGDSLPRGFIDETNFPDSIAMQLLLSGGTAGDTVFAVNKWSALGTCIGCGFYVTDD